MKPVQDKAQEQADEVAATTEQIHLECQEAKARLKQMVSAGERAREEALHMREQAHEMKVWLDNLTN